MLRKRVSKTVIAFLCIVTMLMPYTSNVLGALTHEDTATKLTVVSLHEGGEESSGTLPREYVSYYDETPYKYSIADTTVFKIVEYLEGETVTYDDALYCLDAEKSFPGIYNNEQVGIDYKNVADLKDDTDANVVSLGLSNTNYNALIWLLDNMYLRKQSPEQKDEFLSKAFKDLLDEGVTLDEIKATLTDDDIEVVQQWAMWNFTNSTVEKYTSFGAVSIYDPLEAESGSYIQITGDGNRQVYANKLYTYLVNSAKAGENNNNAKFPSVVKNTISSVVDGEYYRVGPFKVNSGNVPASSYTLALVNAEGIEIDRNSYDILVDGDTEFTDAQVNEIFDKEYYIYLPVKDNTINYLNLKLTYSTYKTDTSLWTAQDKVYQPVVLITRAPSAVKENVDVTIEPRAYDLAVRKFIVKVGNDTVDRTPTVDVTGLKAGDTTTAEYKHLKQAVEVKPGEKVVYEIRVYNEGDIDGKVLEIVDYLPAGLTLADTDLNKTYGWVAEEKDGYTRVSTNYLKDEVLSAFKEDFKEPYSKSVRIECIVDKDLNSGTVLTNVAEIITDNIYDRDSQEGSIDYTKIDPTYSGNKNNKVDLTDDNYFYAGTEDDDDFEKLVVEGGTFDLSLQKFISKVNKVAPATSREPVVDVTP